MKYETVDKMKYGHEEVWFPLSEDILSWDADFHTLMLNDRIRMVAYEKAIKEAIKPGMVVLDLGTGTGILAKWALDAGAKMVYGIDVNKKMIPLAIQRIKEANYSDKFQIFNDVSYKINLPEKVDIIISEILGNLADNEDMIPILEDAKNRFLKKDGVILPKEVDTFIVPICSEKIHHQVKNKKCKGISNQYNIDELLSKLKTKNQFNLYYDAIIPEDKYLSNPQLLREFRFNNSDKTEYQKKFSFVAKKKGMFTGFKGYFISQLSKNVILDISNDKIESRETSDCWKHCYLPIEDPFEVEKGDQIGLIYSRYYPKARNSPFKQCYSWKGYVKRKSIVVYEFRQDMGWKNE